MYLTLTIIPKPRDEGVCEGTDYNCVVSGEWRGRVLDYEQVSTTKMRIPVVHFKELLLETESPASFSSLLFSVSAIIKTSRGGGG